MTASDDDPNDGAHDPTSVTVRPTKIALREERDVRLTKALRDNLAKRKQQIRARAVTEQPTETKTTDD